MADDDEPTLFPMPARQTRAEPAWPEWFTVGKSTPHVLCHRVAKGLHPFGAALHPDETLRCRMCAHRYERRLSKTYWKCKQFEMTGGPATDLRLGWRACERFEPEPRAPLT